jgi:O-antigen/teichoic acid export membrane protein
MTYNKPPLFSMFAASIIGQLIPAAISFISVSILISYFGTTTYGVYTIFVSFASIVASIDFGIRHASIRRIALLRDKSLGEQLITNISLLSKTLCCLSALLFIIPLLLFFLIHFSAPHKLPSPFSPETAPLFILLLLDALSEVLFGASYAGLLAYERHIFINKLTVIRSSMNFIILLIGILYQISILKFALLLCAIKYLQRIILAAHFKSILAISVSQKQNPDIDIKKHQALSNFFFQLFKESQWFFLIFISTKLLFGLDTVLIGGLFGTASAAVYSLPVYLIDQMRNFFTTLCWIIHPRLVHLHSLKQEKDFEEIVYKLFSLITILSNTLIVTLMLFSKEFIMTWTHSLSPFETEQAARNLILLLLPYLFLIPVYVITISVFAVGDQRKIAILNFSECLLYFLMFICIQTVYGIRSPEEVSLLKSFIILCCSGFFLPCIVLWKRRSRFLQYLKKLGNSFCICGIYSLSIYYLKKYFIIHSWSTLIFFNAFTLTFLSIFIYFFYFTKEDRAYLARRLNL